MKKFLSILLAVLMALSMVAFAEEATEEAAEEAEILASPTLELIFESSVEGFTLVVDTDPEKVAAAKDELTALAEAESEADYFGEAAESITAITGAEDITVNEFAPVIAEGEYNAEEMGDVTFTVSCPTVYEAGEKVAVLFGIGGAWSAFEAEPTEDGAISFTLDSDTIQAIIENGAYIAIAK